MGYITSGFKALYARTFGTIIGKIQKDEIYSGKSILFLAEQNLCLYPLGKLLQMIGLLRLKWSVEVSSEGEYNVYRNEGETLYWPAAYSPHIPLLLWGELIPYSPHNYFDLYSPDPEDVVFDIGACEGSFGLRCLQKYSVKKVYFFEPVSLSCAALRLTLKTYLLDERAEIHPAAVADIDGEVVFSNDPLSVNGSHILSQPSAEGEKVPVTTIDKFVQRHGVAKLSLVKMDIEGAEISALRGARKTLRELRPRVLVCAYHRPGDYRDIDEFFAENDYELVKCSWGFPPKLCFYAPRRRT
jgi:FkbM family methyltransferase